MGWSFNRPVRDCYSWIAFQHSFSFPARTLSLYEAPKGIFGFRLGTVLNSFITSPHRRKNPLIDNKMIRPTGCAGLAGSMMQPVLQAHLARHAKLPRNKHSAPVPGKYANRTCGVPVRQSDYTAMRRLLVHTLMRRAAVCLGIETAVHRVLRVPWGLWRLRNHQHGLFASIHNLLIELLQRPRPSRYAGTWPVGDLFGLA